MASNFTEHFQLNQWEASDQVKREDFNADNAKIDAALAGIPKVAVGTYTGDGQPERIIPLPFTPRMVMVCNDTGMMYYSYDIYRYYYGGFAFPDRPVKGNGRVYLSIAENGFKIIYLVKNESSYSYQYTGNQEGSTYIYIAIS